LLISPVTVVQVSAFLDLTAGLVLYLSDPAKGGGRYWLPLAAAIVLGSVAGGVFVSLIAPDVFRRIVGGAVVVLGVWFVFGRSRRNGAELEDVLPARCTVGDLTATAAGGILGGFIGISGPPILWHFGRKLKKLPLRQVLIPIFLAAAVARSGAYAATGIVDGAVLAAYAASIPGLVLGTYAGQRVFLNVSETTFSRAIGGLLCIVGLRLLF
jgi:uncharacterized membrane protein YfcA